MAKGMLQIRLLAGQLKADQGDDRRAGVREIVEGIGGDGDGIADQARKKFPRKQKQVQKNADSAAQGSVSLSHIREIGMIIFLYEMPG